MKCAQRDSGSFVDPVIIRGLKRTFSMARPEDRVLEVLVTDVVGVRERGVPDVLGL